MDINFIKLRRVFAQSSVRYSNDDMLFGSFGTLSNLNPLQAFSSVSNPLGRLQIENLRTFSQKPFSPAQARDIQTMLNKRIKSFSRTEAVSLRVDYTPPPTRSYELNELRLNFRYFNAQTSKLKTKLKRLYQVKTIIFKSSTCIET